MNTVTREEIDRARAAEPFLRKIAGMTKSSLKLLANNLDRDLDEATKILVAIVGQIDPDNTTVGLGNIIAAKEFIARRANH